MPKWLFEKYRKRRVLELYQRTGELRVLDSAHPSDSIRVREYSSRSDFGAKMLGQSFDAFEILGEILRVLILGHQFNLSGNTICERL